MVILREDEDEDVGDEIPRTLDVHTSEVCTHVCSAHKMVMNSKLWKVLPTDVLEIVFSRLPLNDIGNLRHLSKEWKNTMATENHLFFRTCQKAYPKMLALITRNRANLFWVRVLDIKQNKWHTYKLVAGRPGDLNWTPNNNKAANLLPSMTVVCESGGLVCFATSMDFRSKGRRRPHTLFLCVVNPLTQLSLDLPPLLNPPTLQSIMMKVDNGPKALAFKVLVVGRELVDEGWKYPTQIFNSLTKEWTAPEKSSDLFFGFEFQMAGSSTCQSSSVERKYRHGLVAYDFASGLLLHIDAQEYVFNIPCFPHRSTAQYGDRLFSLKWEISSNLYCIQELCCTNRATAWKNVKKHSCDPLAHLLSRQRHDLELKACNGFLMVIIASVKQAWLYDLATSVWRFLTDLPQLQGRRTDCQEGPSFFVVERPEERSKKKYRDRTYAVDLIYEPQWPIFPSVM